MWQRMDFDSMVCNQFILGHHDDDVVLAGPQALLVVWCLLHHLPWLRRGNNEHDMFNCHSTPTSPRQKPYGVINTQLVYHILVLKSSPTLSLLMSISGLPFVTLIFRQLLFGCATRLWSTTESWEWGRLVKVSWWQFGASYHRMSLSTFVSALL